jgi:NADPH:quinone reductase-like Zn-dependent oxidoreductase
MTAMRAMVVAAHGGPEVFERRAVDGPAAPGPGEVRVRVTGSSVNPADVGARRGVFPGPLPAILGYDVAGVVDAVGPGVTEFVPGDAVYYPIPAAHGQPGQSPAPPDLSRGGGYAEYHVAPAPLLARRPANLTDAEAGTVPVAGGTAWAALVTRARVSPGETVLVHGGAGGVGSFAVQIARAAGAARIIATCSPGDIERVRSLGADAALDYHAADLPAAVRKAAGGNGAGVDVCLTTVGGPALAQSLPLLNQNGRAVTVTGPLVGLEAAQFEAASRNLTLHFVHLDDPRPKLEALGALIAAGRVRPLVGRTLPVTEVAEAHRLQEGRGAGVFGKIALEGFPA